LLLLPLLLSLLSLLLSLLRGVHSHPAGVRDANQIGHPPAAGPTATGTSDAGAMLPPVTNSAPIVTNTLGRLLGGTRCAADGPVRRVISLLPAAVLIALFSSLFLLKMIPSAYGAEKAEFSLLESVAATTMIVRGKSDGGSAWLAWCGI
jgi:hypothetical protein